MRNVTAVSAEITGRLIRLVHQALDSAGVIPGYLPTDRQLGELGLSSLKMVNLMLAVEMEFDIMIPATDITPDNFFSVESIARLVAKTLPMELPVEPPVEPLMKPLMAPSMELPVALLAGSAAV